MKIYEYCPHCETEVELPTTAMRQRCPECGEMITVCSLCYGESFKECPYEKEE